MWYRFSKNNIFNQPISSEKSFVKQFATDEDSEINVEETPLIQDPEIPEAQAVEPEITIDDPTGDGFFSPEDLEIKVREITVDPTAGMKLPPLHDPGDPNCYCKIESRPLLSYPGVQDALRVWVVNHFNNDTGRPINNCPKCTESAKAFNAAEKIRLQNKGINVN